LSLGKEINSKNFQSLCNLDGYEFYKETGSTKSIECKSNNLSKESYKLLNSITYLLDKKEDLKEQKVYKPTTEDFTISFQISSKKKKNEWIEKYFNNKNFNLNGSQFDFDKNENFKYHTPSPYGCAENGSCYGDISQLTGNPKTVKVKGYYRKDGTYVRGHYRSNWKHSLPYCY